MKKLSAWWLCLVVCLSSAALWASVNIAGRPQRSLAPSPDLIRAEAVRWRSLDVETALPASPLWSDAMTGYVRVDEAKAARIGVPLSGRVTRVFVDLGYRVERGDPLFSVASSELVTLEGERHAAMLELAAARTQHERVSHLVEAHALPAREGLAAQQQLERAELSLRAAQRQQDSLSIVTRSGNEFLVRAPRAGRVIEKQIAVGEQLSARAANALLTIADLSQVWLVTDLFESDAQGLSLGSQVEVTFPGSAEAPRLAQVDAISALVDRERRTVSVRTRLDNADGQLRINRLAKARFMTSPAAGTLSVPARALGSDGARSYVYVRVGDGEFARRYLDSSSVVADRALLSGDVLAGDEVVVTGVSLLDNRLGGGG